MDKKPLRFFEFSEDHGNSSLAKYKYIAVGDKNYPFLLKYEVWQLLFCNITGSLGFYLRQKFYRSLFNKMGKNVIIGRGVTFRQPQKISIKTGSVIDDYSRITVMGNSNDSRIDIGHSVFIGPYTVCSSRNSTIHIEDNTSIGSHSRIGIMQGNLHIGNYVLVGAYCYIGGGNHELKSIDVPMAKQGFRGKGGVFIEDDVWLGASVVVQDGVRIGKGSVIGACSLVNKDIPPYSIAYGVPARIHESRKKSAHPEKSNAEKIVGK